MVILSKIWLLIVVAIVIIMMIRPMTTMAFFYIIANGTRCIVCCCLLIASSIGHLKTSCCSLEFPCAARNFKCTCVGAFSCRRWHNQNNTAGKKFTPLRLMTTSSLFCVKVPSNAELSSKKEYCATPGILANGR